MCYLLLELQHGLPPLTHEARAFDGVQNMLVEVAVVLHHRVSAVIALALREAVVQRLARAALAAAVVVGMRVNTQEANERVQLTHSVLQRRAGETPLVEGDEVEYSLGSAGATVLD